MKLTKSFYDWCVENNRQDLLDRLDYDLNQKSPNERPFNTRVKTYFKCPCGKHSSTGIYLSMREKSGNYNIICVGCNSFGQWGIDNICNDFLNKYWDYEKKMKQIRWLLLECLIVLYILNVKKKNITAAILCAHMILLERELDVLIVICKKFIYQIHWEMYILNLLIFGQIKISILCLMLLPNQSVKCDSGMHGDYCSQVFRAVERNFECPKCHQDSVDSYLQKKVDEYILGNYSFKYNKEFDCSLICINPLTGYQLPYDRELIINNASKLLIEVNGKQHYEICLHTKTDAKERGVTPEEGFKLLQYRDGIKKNYAISNGYEFLIITYWTEHD